MLKASYTVYTLQFKVPSGTSRGILTEKKSWYIFLRNDEEEEITGIGECSPLKGLSPDDHPGFEPRLRDVCDCPLRYVTDPDALADYPSIRFGLETALLDLQGKGRRILFPSSFTRGESSISINGLVWMGELAYMKKQVEQKISAGFDCLKIKIGAIDFDEELELLKFIRKDLSREDILIRLDANGSFQPDTALEKLKRLSEYDIHSVEQPLPRGRWEEMADLCSKSPVPVALDEELIGIHDMTEKRMLIENIRPSYLVIKPGLLGGYRQAEEWISLSAGQGMGYWITSALESNIGLNAIAQWSHRLGGELHQGLGTGQLYLNNIPSPLRVTKGHLSYDPYGTWDLKNLAHE
jgi:o-succinylbenzoate synthase